MHASMNSFKKYIDKKNTDTYKAAFSFRSEARHTLNNLSIYTLFFNVLNAADYTVKYSLSCLETISIDVWIIFF